MRRRDLIKAIATVPTLWPLAARSQTAATPVVGVLHIGSPGSFAHGISQLRRGLSEIGFSEGRNVTIEYRWAEGHYDRLPALAADLVDRKVTVIFAAGGTDPAKAAKAATANIPIVFISGADPVKAGVVTSFNRPEGNITGVSMLSSGLETKRLGLMYEIIPGAASIGVLLNPKYPDSELQVRELQEAAGVINRQINIFRASTESEIDTAVAVAAQQGAGALHIASDLLFADRREQLAALTTRHKLPASYNQREFAVAGVLFSYGTDIADGYRQAGVYVGKLLRGVSAVDLPVLQSTKFEFVINLKTAKTLGVEISPMLLARADEVIE